MKKALSDKDYEIHFGYDNKYCIAVTKPNALLTNVLPNHDADEFCLNCFGNCQNKELIKNMKRFVKIVITPKVSQKKVKTVLNISTGEKMEVPVNIFKHFFESSSLHQVMLAKIDEAELKLEELRGKKGSTIYCKSSQACRTSFALAIHYSKEALPKGSEYFSYSGEDCMDVFAEKIEKILYGFANFSKQKIIFTEENQTSED